MFQNIDVAKLIIRLSLGIMMLFHGVDKIRNGIGGVKHLVTKAGLPEFFAYGVYVGEVILPIFIILGLYARVASVGVAFTMIFAIFLAYGGAFLALGKHGAPVMELPFLYLVLSLGVFFLGSGRYSLNSK
ncbi:MAG: DoxX family protein [Sulfurimonas sp.]|uniref:DoxX family protein n=1 Tax=Sulfurimonas sp. TaxID=2022749 RepID=UPI0025F64D6F|nr:DoxX family protein [Sulfurimonas sp.]MCK9491152.1 DoxX family protein [Sulfurimonas sp.]